MIRNRSLVLPLVAAAGISFAAELAPGAAVVIDGKKGVVKSIDALPFVDNTYTQRLVWQKPDPKLQALREELRLDERIAPGRDEFDRQLHLMEFVFRLWEFGDPRDLGKTFNPVEIVTMQKKEQRFFCEQYACMLTGCAASMGWNCRLLSIWHHTFNEMWSNQYRKWMFFDPTGNLWAEKDGVPQSAAEVLDDYFKTGLKTVTMRFGIKRDARNVGDRFKDYATVMFHPNTDLLSNRFDYARAFCMTIPGATGHWHKNKEIVSNHLVDPYFPINQAAVTLDASSSGMSVALRTHTPNLKAFRCRIDGGAWANCEAKLAWPLHGGSNVLEVKAVNAFECDGPVSRAEITMEGDTSPTASAAKPAPEEQGKQMGMPALATAPRREGELIPEACPADLKKEWISMWFTNGHWIEWTANAPAAGKYAATIVYSTSYFPKRELQLNGAAAGTFTLPYSGGWNIWKKATLPVKLALKAGSNALRFTCLNETSVWIREIRLARAGSPDIVISPLGFNAEGGGTCQKTFVPNNGFFNKWDEKGHWLEWQVDAPAGEYRVFLRIGALVPAARDMKVNGELIDNRNDWKIPSSGGWRTFTEIPFGTAKFAAGKNTIRMQNLNGDGMNLNAIRFVDATGKEILVNAVDFTDEGGGKVNKMK